MISDAMRHTVVHEAGHAVIARVLTLSCGGATIVADGYAAGHAVVDEPWTCIAEWEKRGKVRDSDRAIWYGRIIAYMAGAESEVVVLGSTQGGDGDDRRQIAQMADEVRDQKWPQREARLRAMTRALIRRHRHKIELVSEALLAETTLTADAIDILSGRSVNDVRVNAPFLFAMHSARTIGSNV